MRGRPQLFTDRHAISVIVSREDYDALRMRAEQIARDQPGYGIADLLRDAVPIVLKRRTPEPRLTDVRSQRVRQLRQISRTALDLAKALDK